MSRKLNRRSLEGLIRWYGEHTNRSPNRTTTYELTLEALNLLHKADTMNGAHPGFRCVDLGIAEKEDPPIKLTERQAQILHLINHQRELVNPNLATNRGIIDALIDLGALSPWREVTVEGRHALSNFSAHVRFIK